ncbi:MAG TPA: sulfite exporter TauE/SafE family protein [Methanocorpusculum sp.]|nr:sulfite exporter TauE/SafE family protein [Methanocorpusculum sp.]
MIDILTVEPWVVVVLVAAGIFAGLMSGLLGVGGGLIFGPVGYFILTALGYPNDTALLTAFGVSLAAAFPTVLTGAITHSRKGNVAWKCAIVMGICGMVLGFVGGWVASVMPIRILTIIFAVVLILGGLKLMMKLPAGTRESMPAPMSGAIGAAGGFFSGLLGVGGGIILVPLMTMVGKFTMTRAAATSAAAIVFITIGGLVEYLIQGYFDWFIWLILTVTAVPCAYLSAAKISGKVSDRWLRILFCILMIVVACKMLGLFDWIGSLF